MLKVHVLWQCTAACQRSYSYASMPHSLSISRVIGAKSKDKTQAERTWPAPMALRAHNPGAEGLVPGALGFPLKKRRSCGWPQTPRCLVHGGSAAPAPGTYLWIQNNRAEVWEFGGAIAIMLQFTNWCLRMRMAACHRPRRVTKFTGDPGRPPLKRKRAVCPS